MEAMVHLDELRDQAAILPRVERTTGFSRKQPELGLPLEEDERRTSRSEFFSAAKGPKINPQTGIAGRAIRLYGGEGGITPRSPTASETRIHRGYLNGKPVKGKWDMGGPTTTPVVDDDEVWIGSSMAGNLNNSLFGSVDEIALYRRSCRRKFSPLVIRESNPRGFFPSPNPGPLSSLCILEQPFEITHQPETCNRTVGTKRPRIRPLAKEVRRLGRAGRLGRRGDCPAVSEIDLEPGDYEFLGRSRGIARLYVDGEQILTFPPPSVEVVPTIRFSPSLPFRAKACVPAFGRRGENRSFTSSGGKHAVVFDAWWEVPSCALNSGKVVWPSQKKAECSACSDQIPAPN